jgi:magnesium transporter
MNSLTKIDLFNLIETKNNSQLKQIFASVPIIDIAETLNDISDPKFILYVFKLCNSDDTAELFSFLNIEQQTKLLELFSDKDMVSLLASSFADDLVDTFNELPANLTSRILKIADPSIRSDINALLKYTPSSAGSIMTTEYVTLPKQFTLKEALFKIREIGKDKETIYASFVVDEKRKLIGAISIEDILFSNETKLVQDVMKTTFISCNVHDDKEDVAQLFKRYDLSVMPVLNDTQHLIGIITIDDIVDVIEDEASEDIQKMAKLLPMDEDYKAISAWYIAKKSIPWLILLLILGALSGFILNQFEGAFQSIAILAAFIPMLMDTGGNAGNQSATLITRAIALNEIKTSDFLYILKKEAVVALMVGLIVGFFSFLWINTLILVGFLSFQSVSAQYSSEWWFELLKISSTVSITLTASIMIAKIVGGILPMIAIKLKKDPAVMASPFVTTIVDIAALLIYFLLANSFFNLF